VYSVYQEEPGGTFEADGVLYDLNGILRDTARLPVNHIALSKVAWALNSRPLDPQRVEDADYSVPVLITLYAGRNPKYKGKPLVVDGEHRCVKAIRDKRVTIGYRLVSEAIMKRHIVKKA
jgi:hypothetical protein